MWWAFVFPIISFRQKSSTTVHLLQLTVLWPLSPISSFYPWTPAWLLFESGSIWTALCRDRAKRVSSEPWSFTLYSFPEIYQFVLSWPNTQKRNVKWSHEFALIIGRTILLIIYLISFSGPSEMSRYCIIVGRSSCLLVDQCSFTIRQDFNWSH